MVPLEIPEDQTSPLMSPVAKQPSPVPPMVPRLPRQQSPAVQSSSSSSQDMTSPPLSPDSLSLYSRLNFSQAKKQDYIPDPPVNERHQSPVRNGTTYMGIYTFAVCYTSCL